MSGKHPLTGQEKVFVMSIYEIHVRGHLDQHWSGWFDELSMSYDENGTTLLRGNLVDEAALYGVLMKVRNLAIPLLSVNRVFNFPAEQEQRDTQEKPNPLSREASPSDLPRKCFSPDESEP
jgi:hypothetical protein